MTWTHRPGYKVEWCAALPVRMRLAGWAEDACDVASQYVRTVRVIYTGNAWRNYARDVDNWLAATRPEPVVVSAGGQWLRSFPLRPGISRFLGQPLQQKETTT